MHASFVVPFLKQASTRQEKLPSLCQQSLVPFFKNMVIPPLAAAWVGPLTTTTIATTSTTSSSCLITSRCHSMNSILTFAAVVRNWIFSINGRGSGVVLYEGSYNY